MVIEHSFVTTAQSAEAFEIASSFLKERGFVTGAGVGVASGTLAKMEWQRGRENANRAKSVSELPQVVRMDFDRGRVNLAASITPSAVWGGRSWTNTQIDVREADVKSANKMKMHHDLLMSILIGLEKLLVDRATLLDAAREWEAVELQIAEAALKRKRRNAVIVTVFVAVMVTFVGMIVYSSTR